MSLVKIMRDDVFTDSLVIASGTGNEHESVKALIKRYEPQFCELGALPISNRESSGGRPEQILTLNEPQASFLMTLLRNSEIVVKFKLRLVKEFYSMRLILMERQTSDWLKTREQGKLIRRDETDAIQALILMAQEQGSQNSGKLYMLYSKLVNRTVGIDGGMRDKASYKQLMLVALLEDIVSKTILEEVDNGTYYKVIYQKCKAKVCQFADLAYLAPMRQISA